MANRGIGLVVAGNNKAYGFKGVSDSTLTGRQWMFAPRIGFAWSPSYVKNFVVRGGFGIYADRGEYFTELSASAGLGISGPFSVTTQEPFTVPVDAGCAVSQNCLSAGPFGTKPLLPPPGNLNGVATLVHNQSQLSGCPNRLLLPALPPATRTSTFSSAVTIPPTSCLTRKTGASTCSGSRRTISC